MDFLWDRIKVIKVSKGSCFNILIPKPFDKRVLTAVAPAVAKAAFEDGVARVKEFDVEAYKASFAKLF